MANKTISQLTAETTVADTMVLEVETVGGASRQMTRANLFAGVPLIDDTADKTATELTTIARADIDMDDDLIMVWDESAGELKSITPELLFDMEVNRPSANFTVNAATNVGTLFAPTGGSTCTIEAMRSGQIVPFRNTSGGTYTFSASGVTITGDTTVADNKAAAIEAITTTIVFITAES